MTIYRYDILTETVVWSICAFIIMFKEIIINSNEIREINTNICYEKVIILPRQT